METVTRYMTFNCKEHGTQKEAEYYLKMLYADRLSSVAAKLVRKTCFSRRFHRC